MWRGGVTMNVQRLGIFGGSFDPVHLGHLLVAHAAHEEMRLDRCVFVPASRSPFKPGTVPAPDALRLRMLRTALAGLPWCEVSELELQRGGTSYTVETVRELGRRYPDARRFLLIGEDHLDGLAEWREVDALLKMVEVVVIPRPGAASVPVRPGLRLHPLRGWPIRVSSSDIRQRLRDRLSVDHLVPSGVGEILRHNRLYLP